MKLYEVNAGKNLEYQNFGALSWMLTEAKGLSYALQGKAFVLDDQGRPLFVYENGKCVKRARIKVSSCAVSPVR